MKPHASVDVFEENVLEHLDDLYSAARRLTRDAPYAEDLTHDAAVRALKSRHQFEPGTNLRAWLLRILTNTFITSYRRGGLEKGVFERTSDGDPVGETWVSAATLRAMHDCEDEALRGSLRATLTTAVDSLPDEYRLTLILSDVEELSYREIAEALHIPIGTVMSRLHRARKILQTMLAEHAADFGIALAQEASNTDANVIAMPTRRSSWR
jgi:RNA polymerase sigma-70 factor (ECF subfamily)